MIHSLSRLSLVSCLTAATAISAAVAQPRPATAPIASGDNLIIQVQASREKLRNLRRKLVDAGYDNVTFQGRSPPYEAQACRDGKLMGLRVGRAGKVRDSKRIGICGRSERFGAKSPVLSRLRDKGYRGIDVLSEGPRRTIFTACKKGDVTRIVVTRDGKIRREVATRQRCDATRRQADRRGGDARKGNRETNRLVRASRPDAINHFLVQRRYRNAKVVGDRGDIVVVEACRRIRKFRVRINLTTQKVVGRKRVGWCDAPRGGQRIARAPRPKINFESDERIGSEQCQNAFEYLLDSEKVYFDTGSANIDKKSLPLLRKVSRIARRCPTSTLEIAGHTDSVGSDSSNQRLSEDRAASVARFLNDKGVERRRVTPKGYGEERPVASNDTDDGRSLNRRIEILVEWDG